MIYDSSEKTLSIIVPGAIRLKNNPLKVRLRKAQTATVLRFKFFFIGFFIDRHIASWFLF